MDVFWQRGYEGASIRELTQAMGINPPSLYGSFGSKEQLFREAVALYDRLEGTATERALRDEPTARAAVEAVLRDNVDAYADPDTPRGCLIVLGTVTWTPENEPVRRHLESLRRATATAIRARLERAVAEGEIAEEADLGAVAAYVNTVLEGLSIQARDGSSRAEMMAIVDCAMAGWDAIVGSDEP